MNGKSITVPNGEGKVVWAPLGAAMSRRLWFLDSTRLCAQARSRTGLEDFGEPAVDPALTVLVEGLEQEAKLHALGRFLMRVHLQDLLATRLRLAAVWRQEAAALDQVPIERPVFIVGMPRSGSTFLHELLAEHPECRAPRVWEVMFPVALAPEKRSGPARRIRKAAACLWWFRRLAPRADAVYPMRAQTPHECVAIHSYTFLSPEFSSTCHLPTYETFLRNSDLTPAYAWQRRFLQHLQLECPGKRWVLKSPDHVHGLAALFAIFPDALIIQTHRNPGEVVKSAADLTRVLRALYGPAGEAEEMEVREASLLALGTERFMQFRDAHPELADRFIDVKYTDLIREPTATVRRICEQIDTPFSETTARRVQALASHRSRYRGRRASAQPAGGKLAAVLGGIQFERYCARFELSQGDLRR